MSEEDELQQLDDWIREARHYYHDYMVGETPDFSKAGMNTAIANIRSAFTAKNKTIDRLKGVVVAQNKINGLLLEGKNSRNQGLLYRNGVKGEWDD